MKRDLGSRPRRSARCKVSIRATTTRLHVRRAPRGPHAAKAFEPLAFKGRHGTMRKNMRAGRRIAARYRNGASASLSARDRRLPALARVPLRLDAGLVQPDALSRLGFDGEPHKSFHVRQPRALRLSGKAPRPGRLFPISERPRSPSSSSAAVAAVATAQPRQLIGSRRNRTAPGRMPHSQGSAAKFQRAKSQPSQPETQPFPAILPGGNSQILADALY